MDFLYKVISRCNKWLFHKNNFKILQSQSQNKSPCKLNFNKLSQGKYSSSITAIRCHNGDDDGEETGIYASVCVGEREMVNEKQDINYVFVTVAMGSKKAFQFSSAIQ